MGNMAQALDTFNEMRPTCAIHGKQTLTPKLNGNQELGGYRIKMACAALVITMIATDDHSADGKHQPGANAALAIPHGDQRLDGVVRQNWLWQRHQEAARAQVAQQGGTRKRRAMCADGANANREWCVDAWVLAPFHAPVSVAGMHKGDQPKDVLIYAVRRVVILV